MSKSDQNSFFTSRVYLVTACIVLICMAALLRFSHLGAMDFGIDEILHVYAAQELIQGKPPVLPSGFEYDRSLPFSYLVAMAGFYGGFNELALRVPSAILGTLVVFFVYWLTTRWYSAFAGLVAAFLTTFSPMEIAHSREVRMYMLFQLLYLLTVFFFYEGFETISPKNLEKSKPSAIKRWIEAYQIRPMFLLCSAGTFLIAWKIHTLIFPAISGFLLYIFMMGVVTIFIRAPHNLVRKKYIGTCLLLLLGASAASLLLPSAVEELTAVIDGPLAWGQENADNWSYYRWLLLDEYPIVFGGLTILLLCCLLKNSKVGLFLCCTLLLPLLLHSLILPMKSYRYIMYIFPLIYMAAGVGIAQLLTALWTSGHSFNNQRYVPKHLWHLLWSGALCLAVLGVLINMPWFMRTVKDYANDYQSPHVTDVQHHRWKNAMQYISEHQRDEDVIVSGYPLLSRHYGATHPLYFMNNVYLLNNEQGNQTNEQGELIDYTFGAPVLKNLEDLKRILNSHKSGWVMTYKWRQDRFWNNPDIASPTLGMFSHEVLCYIEDHLERQSIPNAPDMALWRWSSGVIPKNGRKIPEIGKPCRMASSSKRCC
ncbi:MAG: hypothetical protein NPIRA01_13780 [Nitrospirales bacterium]|nr:MAG: hypothetical protein NPIRA01_13780 [Nitrospirales bacterium]